MTQESLVRSLGLKEALALVVGTVIGTGVFLKAAVMAQQTGSPYWVLAAWAVAGVLSLAGALCYAELGGLFPRAGGEYVYLKEAYGGMAGFLYGWMRFWIGTPGSIAAYAVGAATFLGGLVPLGGGMAGKTVVALGVIGFFSLVNCFSVAFGGRIQSFMTALKIIMILCLTTAIFTAADTGAWTNLASSSDNSWRGWSAFGTAMIAALWAYDGWNSMPMAAGEIRDPGKNIPRALIIGMLIILGLYGLANLSYFYAMPFDGVLASYSKTNPEALPVATRAAEAAFGKIAVGLLSVAFVFSALGSMNGSILTGARIPFAMARDNLFFKQLGEVSHASRTPVPAVVAQGLVSALLAMSGTFDQLTDYVVFSSWIFYALVTASLFVFRKRMPEAVRPYRTPLYPYMPIVFLIVSTLLLINTLITAPRESGIGLAFILAGIPFYYWFKKRKAAEEAQAEAVIATQKAAN